MSFAIFKDNGFGNIAIIPIEGIIMGSGSSTLGQQIASSKNIVSFIEDANQNPQIKAIVLEINSPGGSPVASDEISTAIKQSTKPVVSLIREVGASGGYWVSSATEYSVANRMSITGSIGVVSSYLEFSGLMEQYGVGYERLVSGNSKDIGSPFKKLSNQEKQILQKKIDLIHNYFVDEVATNRNLERAHVEKLATGEFYLGVEALELGLIDELGDLTTIQNYLTKQYDINKFDYIHYQRQVGLFDIFSSIASKFSFNIGQGIGSSLVKEENNNLLMI